VDQHGDLVGPGFDPAEKPNEDRQDAERNKDQQRTERQCRHRQYAAAVGLPWFGWSCIHAVFLFPCVKRITLAEEADRVQTNRKKPEDHHPAFFRFYSFLNTEH
jgi:hypothetical protein